MSKSGKKRIPSMADIAELSGVNKMTVSRAINGHPYVSEPVRKKVLEVAERLGYRKNKLVSNVMTQVARSRSVDHGVPIIFLSDALSLEAERGNSSTQKIIRNGRERALSYGFSYDVLRYRDGSMTNERLDQVLEARGVQGVVINVGQKDPVELNLNWDRLVAVTSGGRLKHPKDLPQVLTDRPRSMRILARELDARGYRRAGFVMNRSIDLEVYSGFTISNILLYQHDRRKEEIVPMLSMARDEIDRNQFMVWFEEHRPDVVISWLQSSYDWLIDAGYRIPEDVGFVFTNGDEPGLEISGTVSDRGLLADAAIDQVVQGLMAGKYGLQESPGRYLVPQKWNEGKTLRPRGE